MGRHDHERDRHDDYDRNRRVHRSDDRGERRVDRRNRHSEEKYSLQELKQRAREEVSLSNRNHRDRHHYDDRRRADRDHQPHRRKDEENQRQRSRSRSRDKIAKPKQDYDNQRKNRDQRERRDAPKGDNDYHRNRSNFDRSKARNNHDGDISTRDNDDGGDRKMADESTEPKVEPAKPNFELTGNLAKDTNMFNGVLVKYNEPGEAKIPKKRWRFYPFKGDTALDFIALHRQSAYMFGRDRRVVDVPIDHPSCSKQHAVLQFRSIEIEREDGTKARATRPYIIDLESGNGTFVNNKQIEPKRYIELLERDVVKFGFSTREYVMLHEQSQGEAPEDDIEAA